MHMDGYEGATSANSMHEHGWRKLNCIMAFLPEHLAAITKWYTCKIDAMEIQTQKMESLVSETMSDMFIAKENATLSSGAHEQ
eukprot:12217627-Ditylum_brightwellii.AAC.1